MPSSFHVCVFDSVDGWGINPSTVCVPSYFWLWLPCHFGLGIPTDILCHAINMLYNCMKTSSLYHHVCSFVSCFFFFPNSFTCIKPLIPVSFWTTPNSDLNIPKPCPGILILLCTSQPFPTFSQQAGMRPLPHHEQTLNSQDIVSVYGFGLGTNIIIAIISSMSFHAHRLLLFSMYHVLCGAGRSRQRSYGCHGLVAWRDMQLHAFSVLWQGSMGGGMCHSKLNCSVIHVCVCALPSNVSPKQFILSFVWQHVSPSSSILLIFVWYVCSLWSGVACGWLGICLLCPSMPFELILGSF